MDLKKYVQTLENLKNRQRGDWIIDALVKMGVAPLVQELHHPAIRNIIVDFPSEINRFHVLVSAHYDVVKGSPGANDNASGVAVLLGLCQELKTMQVAVRVVFFDREEAWLRTPFVKLGLLGSCWYVIKNNIQKLEAAYNLEFVGNGDILAVWPVKQTAATLSAVQTIKIAAEKVKVPVHLAHIPWVFLSSDHLAFRLKGMRNSITISLIPSTYQTVMTDFFSKLNVLKMIFTGRPAMPEPLSQLHEKRDTSQHITEDSMQLILSVLLEVAKLHHGEGNIQNSEKCIN